jgi:hypothetical protein
MARRITGCSVTGTEGRPMGGPGALSASPLSPTVPGVGESPAVEDIAAAASGCVPDLAPPGGARADSGSWLVAGYSHPLSPSPPSDSRPINRRSSPTARRKLSAGVMSGSMSRWRRKPSSRASSSAPAQAGSRSARPVARLVTVMISVTRARLARRRLASSGRWRLARAAKRISPYGAGAPGQRVLAALFGGQKGGDEVGGVAWRAGGSVGGGARIVPRRPRACLISSSLLAKVRIDCARREGPRRRDWLRCSPRRCPAPRRLSPISVCHFRGAVHHMPSRAETGDIRCKR